MLFFSFFENIYKLFLQQFYLYIIWISTKPCITPVEGMNAYRHKYAYQYTYIHISVIVIPWLSVNLEAHCILYKKNRLLYEACCSSNNKDHVSQFNSSVLPSVTSSNIDEYWSLDLSLSQQIHYSCSISPHQMSQHFVIYSLPYLL
jgi:hypothetical protein